MMSTLYVSLFTIFSFVSADFNLPPGMLRALCYVESAHNVNAVHNDDGTSDSLGVCQIKLETAKLLGFKGTKKDLMVPGTNVYYAGKYLHKQLKRYKNNNIKAIAAYNAGTYKKTDSGIVKNKHYVNKVLAAWANNK